MGGVVLARSPRWCQRGPGAIRSFGRVLGFGGAIDLEWLRLPHEDIARVVTTAQGFKHVQAETVSSIGED